MGEAILALKSETCIPAVRSSSDGRRGREPLVGDHTISCCADEGMNSGIEIFMLRRLMIVVNLWKEAKLSIGKLTFLGIEQKGGNGVGTYCLIRFRQCALSQNARCLICYSDGSLAAVVSNEASGLLPVQRCRSRRL